MRDGQPPVRPRLQSVSLSWENEGTEALGYLPMSVFIFFFLLHLYFRVQLDWINVSHSIAFSKMSGAFFAQSTAENVTVQAKYCVQSK